MNTTTIPFSFRWYRGLLVAALFAALATGAMAQTTLTLQVVDGTVTVNGRTVEPERLPASFDTRQDFRMQVSALDTTVVAFGDRYYVLEKDGLREASPREIEIFGLPSVAISGNYLIRSSPSAANQQLVTQLSNLVTELDQGGMRTAPGLRDDAMRAAQTAAALPHLELQDYWFRLRKEDQGLFDDFLRERRLEAEAYEIARAIMLAPPAQRSGLQDELRAVLRMSFELKQRNRQREIEQLELRLEDLRRSLDDRAVKQDQIIERRYRELLDQR